jgi:hypothetical protein
MMATPLTLRIFVADGDPIKPRLASHHSGPAQKDFWTRVICFVSMGQGTEGRPPLLVC